MKRIVALLCTLTFSLLAPTALAATEVAGIKFEDTATFGERAVDVFYVQNALGAKIENKQKLRSIEKKLLAVFEEGECAPAKTDGAKKEPAKKVTRKSVRKAASKKAVANKEAARKEAAKKAPAAKEPAKKAGSAKTGARKAPARGAASRKPR